MQTELPRNGSASARREARQPMAPRVNVFRMTLRLRNENVLQDGLVLPSLKLHHCLLRSSKTSTTLDTENAKVIC
jgi:hypothetical protein